MLIIYVFIFSLFFIISLRWISKFLFFLSRIGVAPEEEFPEISDQLLDKFTSFDPQLGWEPQPNEVKKKDTGHQRPDDPYAEKVTYTTDEFGSRVCPVERSTGSYCQMLWMSHIEKMCS